MISFLRQVVICWTLVSYPIAAISGPDLPYDEDANAALAVEKARFRAKEEGKFLMVTFGASWCPDCNNLHRQLHTAEVQAYTQPRFHFAYVDVGRLDQNLDYAKDLGVNLEAGIPVAIFFDPSGTELGNTNRGELELARRYSSKQILKFLRDVAERSRIAAPDSVD